MTTRTGYAPTWRKRFDETAVNDATTRAWNQLSAQEQKLLSPVRSELISAFGGLGVMGSRHIGDVV